MQRIVKISRIFRIIFLIVLFIVPLFKVISWIMAPYTIHIGTAAFGLSYNPIPSGLQLVMLTPGVKVSAFLIDMLVIAPNMLVLYFLTRLFGNYQQQQIFTAENVKLIRNIGYTLLIWQVLTPIQQALLSLVLTIHNPPGLHIIQASFSSNNIAVIFIALIVIVISWVMGVGHKLQQEQEYTI